MSRDANGTFSLLTNSNYPAVSGTRIASSTHNAQMEDFEDAFNVTPDQLQNIAWTDAASGSTVDIGAVASSNVRITGTTTITSLGTSRSGISRTVRFAAALTLTHNATSLILPGGADIVTIAGDTCVAVSLGSGNWVVVSYQRSNGVPVRNDGVRYIATYAALTALTTATGLADNALYYVYARATEDDGAEGFWRYDAGSTATANGGTILAIDGGGSGRFVRQFDGYTYHSIWWPQTAAGLTLAFAAAAGKQLFIDGPISGITTAITISTQHTHITGAGPLVSVLTSSHATNNIITVTAPFVTIDNVGFACSTTRSGGWFVDVSSAANRFTLRNFYMEDWIGGVRIQGGASQTVADGMIFDGIATTGVAVRADGGFDVTVSNVISDQASQIFAGVYVTGGGDITIEDSQFIHCGNALSIVATAGQVLTSVWGINTFFDNSTRGMLGSATGVGAVIARCRFTQCWFSSSTNSGIELTTDADGQIDGFDFVNCEGHLNGVNGVYLNSARVSNVNIVGGAYCQNTGSGFLAIASVTRFSAIGAKFGNGYGLTGNNYGIFLSGSNDNYRFIGCDLRNNTTAAVSGASYSATKIWQGNLAWVTSNVFTASVADGGTIAHGCNGTPRIGQAQASVSGEFISVTAIDATNLTLAIKKHDNSAGTTQTVYCSATL